MTGDCHAGICGSLGARFPQATRPLWGHPRLYLTRMAHGHARAI